MNNATAPRLRDEVIVRPFDDRGARQRYVVAVDGHHFVVTPAIAALLDETRGPRADDRAFDALARRVSHRLGTSITPLQVETLICERIPKALFEPATGVNAEQSPLMLSRLLFSGATLEPILSVAARLFEMRTAITACALFVLIDALVALTVWAHGVREPIVADYFLSFALTLAGIFVHELGHLSACHRFGGRHGGIGVGIYWCLPAFYAEVHGAWTLPRKQRAAVDAGGVYLQSLFVGVLGAIYLATSEPALLDAIVLSHLLMLHTLNPVLKFDGYWLLCDLAGIHNLHLRVRDAARRLFKRGQTAARSEIGLLIVFASVAILYFAYLLAVLGHHLGTAVASFLFAATTTDPSTAALLSALGKGLLLALMLAMAFGIALMLARAGGAVFTEKPDEP